MMLVTAQPGKGLGFAITATDDLRLEASSINTRVRGQILGHQSVINEPTGRYEMPFKVTAPPDSCGRTFTLSASIATVDRNRSPSGDGTAPVRVSVEALRAPGGVAKLELSDVDRLDASSRPPEAHFLSRGAGGGAVTIYFKQAAGHIIVDCAVHSPSDVRFTIDAGSLHIENTAPAADGHAVRRRSTHAKILAGEVAIGQRSLPAYRAYRSRA